MANSKKKTSYQRGNKNVEKQISQMGDFEENKSKIFIIILSVLIFLSIFYLLTVYITNKDNNKSNTQLETEIQYEEILAGSSFNMNESEYLVVYYDKTDTDLGDKLSTKVDEYKAKENSLTVYTVDLSSAFNKTAISGNKSNTSPKDASELALVGPTLIKFKKGSVVDYIENVDNIIGYLS